LRCVLQHSWHRCSASTWPKFGASLDEGLFGRRQDAVFLELQTRLEPFGITRFYTDGWGAYERHIAPEQHTVGKQQTQKIESKHINVRTRIKRLVRRTICFSTTTTMHDVVIGLFSKRYECGLLI